MPRSSSTNNVNKLSESEIEKGIKVMELQNKILKKLLRVNSIDHDENVAELDIDSAKNETHIQIG
jgi:hypothetical protein